MRQEVIYYPYKNQFGQPPKSVPVRHCPDRVWSIAGRAGKDPNVTPQLPIRPTHLHTAFMEDRGHDWIWRNGQLKYNGGGEIWLLLEYKEAPPSVDTSADSGDAFVLTEGDDEK